MVVVPGLSESLRAVDKRIVRFDAMNTLLSVDVAGSARRGDAPRAHMAVLAGTVSIGASLRTNRAWSPKKNHVKRCHACG